MALADIGTELHALAEAGYHEVVLTGINLGEYADDDGYRFIDVLRLIEVVAPPFRVRISSIEPNTLSAEIIEFIAHSNVIVPHVHVPLQSGDAEILKQMRRRYNPAMYERTIKHVRESMPHAGIGIDVIVGFPGETDAHFKNSYEFIERLPFTYLHVFTYSEREGTPASTYAHRIPMHVRKERTARLRTLSLQRQQEFATSQLGTCRTVISDSYNPATATLTGITENNIQVSFTGPESMHRTSQRVTLDTLTPTGAKGWLAT
jgi:threonylcarbamoyladenosine tRNA methylthiotransferase MtaB